ncbi:hypothetical protein ABZU86_10135 [Streptomyces sp. NPDC005271]|uniref:hypothetical protein n=1 Tax=unclassified Streptomyces TaxID=2593676 RepID=UPI0033AC26C7
MHSEAVAAFVFLRNVPRSQVLVGIRRPEVNDRHPGVVSVPTLRIPAELVPHMVPATGAGEVMANRDLRGPRRSFGTARSTTTPEGLLVEAVLSKKLRMGDALESGLVAGCCAVRCVLGGEVDDPTGRDGRLESTLMVTIEAELDHGAHRVPDSTASYSALSWAEPMELATAWRTRDGQRLFPDASPLEVCMRGLCVQSAVRVIETRDAQVV